MKGLQLISRRPVDISLLLVALGAFAVGCSEASEAKEYGVPKSLCGVPVASKVLERLLPPGQAIDVQEKSPAPSRKLCQVHVDDRLTLAASQEWWEKTDTLIGVANAHPKLDSAQPTDSYVYLSSGTGAVGRVKDCTSPDHTRHTLYAIIEVHAEGVSDAAAMKELITGYAKAVETGGTCR